MGKKEEERKEGFFEHSRERERKRTGLSGCCPISEGRKEDESRLSTQRLEKPVVLSPGLVVCVCVCVCVCVRVDVYVSTNILSFFC